MGELEADPGLFCEHWAPECKMMSRSRGKPFYIGGVYHTGPPAVRDENHVMGFPWLDGHLKARLRQSNKMGIKALTRCSQLHRQGKLFSLEHPHRSWLWYFRQAIELGK